MFAQRKLIFAGKHNLQPKPFCPYLTDQNGYASLARNSSSIERSNSLSFPVRTRPARTSNR